MKEFEEFVYYSWEQIQKVERSAMKVQLKCLSSLSRSQGCDHKTTTTVHLSDNSTVESIISEAGVLKKDVKIVFVNGKLADSYKPLADNDTVALVPAVGGM